MTVIHNRGDGSINDTDAVTSPISRDIAYSLGMKPEPTDITNSVQGVGGSESVIEKGIDAIRLDDAAAANFSIQIMKEGW